jgi:hypothetical protein
MDVEKIRQVRNAKPFGRFTLELEGGRLLPVKQPYFLGISPQGKELTYAPESGGFEHLPTAKVVALHQGIIHRKAG